MSNKFLILIIAILIIAGGVLLLSNQAKNKNTVSNKPEIKSSAVITQSANASRSPKKIEEIIVTATDAGFSPKEIKTKAGTKVVWLNKSNGTITVNSDEHPTHRLYPMLNLGSFGKNSSVQVVFDKTGTYKYHNHLNASQSGTVFVE